MNRRTASDAISLEILGITAEEEQSYRLLLARGLANAGEIARELGVAPRTAQRLLEALAAKGLATHAPERPRRYLPVLPEFAVEAIVSQRKGELERVRAVIPTSGNSRHERRVRRVRTRWSKSCRAAMPSGASSSRRSTSRGARS
jgi:sugar-specific transcriptional regulator TrmB